jgi:hypothetical protein
MTKTMTRLENVIQTCNNRPLRIWEEAQCIWEKAQRMPNQKAAQEHYHFRNALIEHCHTLIALRAHEPELAKASIKARDAEIKIADAWAADELWTRTATAHLTTDELRIRTHVTLTEHRWAEARRLLDDLGLRNDIHTGLASAQAYGLTGPYQAVIQDRIDLVNAKVG